MNDIPAISEKQYQKQQLEQDKMIISDLQGNIEEKKDTKNTINHIIWWNIEVSPQMMNKLVRIYWICAADIAYYTILVDAMISTLD